MGLAWGPGNREFMVGGATTGRGSLRGTRFALAKFRPPALPATLVTRSVLHELLTAGSGQRLTVVVGSAGAGKSVLLADWAAARPPGTLYISRNTVKTHLRSIYQKLGVT